MRTNSIRTVDDVASEYIVLRTKFKDNYSNLNFLFGG